MQFKRILKYLLRNMLRPKNIIVTVLFLGLVGSAVYFYVQNKQHVALLNNPTQATEEETTALVKKIGAFMDLPKDEKPTLISVVDKAKLKDQQFFSKAENGDKVLVYTAAKEAILYRPSTNKIIEVGPVSMSTESNLKVALYNTTTDKDLIKSTEDTLNNKVTNLTFSATENVSYNTDTNLVIDLTGDKKTEADQLARLLNGKTLTALPEGMAKPDADFVILIAK